MIVVPIFSGNPARNVGPNTMQSQSMTQAVLRLRWDFKQAAVYFVIPGAKQMFSYHTRSVTWISYVKTTCVHACEQYIPGS